MSELREIISILESLFSFFNEAIFENALSKPVITIMQDTTSGAYGWCTSWKAWETSNGQGYYEINICADYLNRPIAETAETLLHEMVHLYNLEHDVKDTSRSGKYHNKKFKEAAESHGLIVKKSEKYGYSTTCFTPETAELFKSSCSVSFDLFRASGTKEKKKSSTRKYVCPSCGLMVRATKQVLVSCVECDEILQAEETDNG